MFSSWINDAICQYLYDYTAVNVYLNLKCKTYE